MRRFRFPRLSRPGDAGRMGLGGGMALSAAALFALVTGVQAADTYGAGTGGGASGARSGDIAYQASDITPGGAMVPCGPVGQTTELTCKAYESIVANFPEFDRPDFRGCYRAGPPDHGTGQACDLMTNVKGTRGTEAENAVGDELARWLMTHHEQMGVKYVIWRQRIWNPTAGDAPCPDESTVGSAPPTCWRAMGDRGSNTQNHYDHVHVSFRY
ncbi:hypothetical protein ACFOVU_19490 [Nocardiopsis sediminis]|uniref:ARB-07466-like C-terminal domain-containing protein n=1 Tax=Nocardiopsis sediminis TaxID=1778267 RepID=A0ABV8FPV1_9ACTN